MKYLVLFLMVSSFPLASWATATTQTGRVLETVPISSQMNHEESGGNVTVAFQIYLKNISKSQDQKVTIKLQDLQIIYWGRVSGCEPWFAFCPQGTIVNGGIGSCTTSTPPPAAYNCYQMDTCEDEYNLAATGACGKLCGNILNANSTKDCRISKEEDSLIRIFTKREVGGVKKARTERFQILSGTAPFIEVVAPASSPANIFSTSLTEHFKKWTRSGKIRTDLRSRLNLFDAGEENLSRVIADKALIPAGTSRMFKVFLHCGAFQEGLKCKFSSTQSARYPLTLDECREGGNPKVEGPCLSNASVNVISSFKFEVQEDPGALLGSTSTDIDFVGEEIIPVQTIPLNNGRPF